MNFTQISVFQLLKQKMPACQHLKASQAFVAELDYLATGDCFNGSLARERWESHLSSLRRQLGEISFLWRGGGREGTGSPGTSPSFSCCVCLGFWQSSCGRERSAFRSQRVMSCDREAGTDPETSSRTQLLSGAAACCCSPSCSFSSSLLSPCSSPPSLSHLFLTSLPPFLPHLFSRSQLFLTYLLSRCYIPGCPSGTEGLGVQLVNKTKSALERWQASQRMSKNTSICDGM